MLRVEKSTQKLIFENALKNIKWSIKPFRCGRPALSSLSVGSQISSEKGSILLFCLLEPEILNLPMPPKTPTSRWSLWSVGSKENPGRRWSHLNFWGRSWTWPRTGREDYSTRVFHRNWVVLKRSWSQENPRLWVKGLGTRSASQRDYKGKCKLHQKNRSEI